MKLLNREPTEEMIKAAYAMYESDSYTGFISIFKAMYDAAPDGKINMNTVAWVEPESTTSTVACFMDAELDDEVKTDMIPLYSFEQIARISNKG